MLSRARRGGVRNGGRRSTLAMPLRNRGRRSTLAMPLPKSWQAQHSVHLGVCLCGRGRIRQLSRGTGCCRARGGGRAKSWQAQHFGDAVAKSWQAQNGIAKVLRLPRFRTPPAARATTSCPSRQLPNATPATQTHTQMHRMLRLPRLRQRHRQSAAPATISQRHRQSAAPATISHAPRRARDNILPL